MKNNKYLGMDRKRDKVNDFNLFGTYNGEVYLMSVVDLLIPSDKDLYRAAIKNTLMTYPLEWKVIFEALQNSIDAINKNVKIQKGKIVIDFNIDEKQVTIEDNGIGFPPKRELFFLHGGTKRDDLSTKGKIGVGLKAILFSSKNFHINSIYTDADTNKEWSLDIEDADKYENKDKLDVQFSDSSITTPKPTGTILSYTFRDDSVLDFIKRATDTYSLISNKMIKSNDERFKYAIEYFFRTNSYAADVLKLLGISKDKDTTIEINIKYKLIPNRLDTEIRRVLKSSNGIITITFGNKFWDIKELIDEQKGINKILTIAHEFYKPNETFGNFSPDNVIWIKKFTNVNSIKELLPKKRKEEFNNILDKVNGVYLAVGRADVIRKFFFNTPIRAISINGVISDHYLPNPTAVTVYANMPLCIIDIDSTFNSGKLQTTDRRLVHYVGELYLAIYRNAIVKIGEALGGDSINESSADEIEKPTKILSLPDLNINSSLKKIPIDENTLIALFFDLLGRGKIEGYTFYSLSAKQKYDGKGMIKLQNMKEIPTPYNDADLKTIEFKLKLSALLDDFENGDKDLKDITFLVIWEDDISNTDKMPENYGVIDIDESKDAERSSFGVKKCLIRKTDGIEKQMFIMKDFITSLNTTKPKRS